MKNFVVLALVSAGSLCSSLPISAQTGESAAMENKRTVPWREVSRSAQQTLQLLSGKDVIVRTEQGVVNGQTVYRAMANQSGRSVEHLVTADGSMFSPRNTVAWNELPSAVQESYSSLNNQQALQEILAEIQNSRTVYDFALNNSGSKSNMQLAQDGTILGYQPAKAGDVIKESAGANRPNSTEQIPFENISQAAQKTITSMTGGAAVRSVTAEDVKGVLCYDVRYEGGGVCVASDGQVVK